MLIKAAWLLAPAIQDASRVQQTHTHMCSLFSPLPTSGSKKPLNTGRADYFGMVANVAARMMAQAQPGQVGKGRGRRSC